MYLINRSLFICRTVILSSFLAFFKSDASSNTSVFLKNIARLYSMGIRSNDKKIELKNRYNNIEFEKKGRRVWINNIMLYLHKPCQKVGKSWSINEDDFRLNIDPIIRSYKNSSKKTPKKIVLDPGHGGGDTGAISPNRVLEKQIVYDIAILTKHILIKHGFKVYLTRENDNYITLDQRVEFTKKIKADLFISIHANAASSSRSANGIETFISTLEGFDSSNSYGRLNNRVRVPNNKYDFSNAVLGYALQSNLIKILKRYDRGLRRARFKVIKNSPCPAALVECGFLTNEIEESLLRDKNYRIKVANGIANGVRAYKAYILK